MAAEAAADEAAEDGDAFSLSVGASALAAATSAAAETLATADVGYALESP